MLYEPLRRRRTGSDAAWILAWILLLVVAGAAVVAAIYSVLDYDRIEDDSEAVLAAIAQVQAGVTSLLSSAVAILSDLALLLTKVDAIQATCSNVTVAGQCVPIFTAGMVLEDSCYYFANPMTCDFPGAPCFLVRGGVQVDMRGQTLDVASAGSTAFYMFAASDFELSNGAIVGSDPLARGVEVWSGENVWIDSVRMSHLYTPLFAAFSSGVFVTHSVIANATGTDYSVVFLGTSDVSLYKSSFISLNLPGDPVDGVLFHGVDTYTMDGLAVVDCTLIDSTLRFGTEATSEPMDGFSVLDSRFSVTDPTFAGSWLEIGAPYCLSGDQCSTPSTGLVAGNTFSNTDAAPGFDGVVVERVNGLRFQENVLTANPTGFAPASGVVGTALLHICLQNTRVGMDFVGTGTCVGVTLRENTLTGAVSGSAVRATNGIIFEGGTDGVLAEYNQLTGFGTGQPSNSSYPTCLSLQNATSFAVIADTAVNNTGASLVSGSVGGTVVTGFPPGVVSNGAVHQGDSTFAAARGEMNALYACLLALPCEYTISGNLGGQTFGPGVLCYTGSATLTGTLTLNMLNPESVFVIKISGSLTVSPGSGIITIGSTACNVFWQVGGPTSFGASADFIGNVLSYGTIAMGSGASILGRLFSETGDIDLADNAVQGTDCTATLEPFYPAQMPAAILVRGGTQYVHLFANSIKDVACETGGAIAGDGILFTGYEILESWAPPGSGLVDFQAPWGNSVQANQVSGVCSGWAMEIHGDETNFWHNEVHANNRSYVAGAGVSGVVLCYGQTEVAGWNLDGDCS